MEELYDKLVAMRDRLEKFEPFPSVKDHLEEIKLCIAMVNGKAVNAKNEDFVKSIFEDALEDAENTVKDVENTLVRIG
jgi:hypothetical protein